MDWKQEAADKLRQYLPMRNALKNIPLELRSLEADSHSLRSGIIHLPRGSENMRENMLLDNLVKRRELEAQLEQVELWLHHVDSGLADLSAEDKMILTEMYIRSAPGGADRVCEKLGIERSSAYRQRDRALRCFTLNLYGDS